MSSSARRVIVYRRVDHSIIAFAKLQKYHVDFMYINIELIYIVRSCFQQVVVADVWKEAMQMVHMSLCGDKYSSWTGNEKDC